MGRLGRRATRGRELWKIRVFFVIYWLDIIGFGASSVEEIGKEFFYCVSVLGVRVAFVDADYLVFVIEVDFEAYGVVGPGAAGGTRGRHVSFGGHYTVAEFHTVVAGRASEELFDLGEGHAILHLAEILGEQARLWS